MKRLDHADNMTTRPTPDHRPLYLLLLPLFLLLFSSYAYALDLNYWIEPDSAGNPTKVWIKVPNIPAGGSITIYARKEAGFTPDPHTVFIFFDDFETWSGWTNYSSGVVSQDCTLSYSGSCALKKASYGDPNGGYKAIGTTINFPVVLEGRVDRTYLSGSNADRIGLIDNSGNGYGWLVDHGADTTGIDKRSSYTATVLGKSSMTTDITNAWYSFRFIWNNGTIISQTYSDPNWGTLVGEYSTTDTTYSSFTRVYVFGGYTYYVDDLRIRKYAPNEPTVTVTDKGGYYEITISNSNSTDLTDFQVSIPATDLNVTSTTESIHFSDQPFSGLAVSVSYFPMEQNQLALDPENNITTIEVNFTATISAIDTNITYWKWTENNVLIQEGNTEINTATLTREYNTVGDYNVCFYAEATDGTSTYTDQSCTIVHIDEYPQNLTADYTPKVVFPDENITLTASTTDNGTLTYEWNVEGNTYTGASITVSFPSPGTYTATVTATDDVGLSKTITIQITVFNYPNIVVTPTNPHVDEPVTFEINTDPGLTVISSEWNIPDFNIEQQATSSVSGRFTKYGWVFNNPYTYNLIDGTLYGDSTKNTWTFSIKETSGKMLIINKVVTRIYNNTGTNLNTTLTLKISRNDITCVTKQRSITLIPGTANYTISIDWTDWKMNCIGNEYNITYSITTSTSNAYFYKVNTTKTIQLPNESNVTLSGPLPSSVEFTTFTPIEVNATLTNSEENRTITLEVPLYVKPITLSIALKDEDTGADWNTSAVDLTRIEVWDDETGEFIGSKENSTSYSITNLTRYHNYRVTVTVQKSTLTYSRTYYIQGYDMDLTAYLLDPTKGLYYTLFITDLQNNPLEGYYVEIRKYISGSYRTINMPKSNPDGSTSHFITPATYYYVYVKDPQKNIVKEFTWFSDPNVRNLYIRVNPVESNATFKLESPWKGLDVSVSLENNTIIKVVVTDVNNRIEWFRVRISKTIFSNIDYLDQNITGQPAGGTIEFNATPGVYTINIWVRINGETYEFPPYQIAISGTPYFQGPLGISDFTYILLAIIVTFAVAGFTAQFSPGASAFLGLIVLGFFTLLWPTATVSGISLWHIFLLTTIVVAGLSLLRAYI